MVRQLGFIVLVSALVSPSMALACGMYRPDMKKAVLLTDALKSIDEEETADGKAPGLIHNEKVKASDLQAPKEDVPKVESVAVATDAPKS